LEKSCQLEGMMESVISKEQELQKALDEIKRLRDGLRNKIEMVQQQTPEHPIICAPKVLEEDTLVTDESDLLAINTHPTTPPKMSPSESSSPGGLRLSESTDSTVVEAGDRAYSTQHLPSLNSPAHSCPMPTYVDPINHSFMEGPSTGLPSYRVYNDDDLFGLSIGFGCGSALFGERLLDRDRSSDQLMSLSFDDSFVEDSNTVGGRSRASAYTMPLPGPLVGSESPGRPDSPVFRTASFDNGVNFRTGMSGHRGLNQTRKKGASSSPSARREVRMMSVHSGIGASRGTNRRAETQSNSLGTRVLTPPDRIQS
jgi:hypothetical protein